VKIGWYTRLLSALYLSTYLIRTSFGMIVGTLQLHLEHVSYAQLGDVQAAVPLFEFFTVPVIGAVIDRYGRKTVLLLGLFLGALSLLLLAFTMNITLLFIINGIHGIASGCILVSSLALLADYVPLESRGREIGMFDGVNLAGWGSGFLLGGVFGEWFRGHLEDTFYMGAVMATIGFVYALLNVTEPEKKSLLAKDVPPLRLFRVLFQPRILLLVAPWAVIYILLGTLTAFSYRTGTENLNLSPAAVGALLFAGCLLILFTQRFYGALSDKYGRWKVMALGTVGIVGIMAIVMGSYILLPGAVEDPAVLTDFLLGNKAVLALLGILVLLSGAFAPSALASLTDEADKKARGTTMSLYSMVISMGMFIGPVISGRVAEVWGGYGVAGFLGGCMGFMAVCVYLKRRITARK